MYLPTAEKVHDPEEQLANNQGKENKRLQNERSLFKVTL